MKHTRERDFGRPVSAVFVTEKIIDKWDVLNELADAQEHFGLCHRSLNVLRALISFLPTRSIDPTPLGAIVFPSNKTLSKRLNGIPESTLRRQMTNLIKSGLVIRHDSANRKRFARAGQAGRIAFGFDLSPLARHFDEIADAAATSRAAQSALEALRAEVAGLRAKLIETAPHDALSEAARRVLRRKPVYEELALMKNALETALQSTKVSATDEQNERHIQPEKKISSVKDTPKSLQSCQIEAFLSSCNEYKCFFPEGIQSSRDLYEIASRLAQMIDIHPAVFNSSVQSMGKLNASLCIIAILERLDAIDNPGGYLRHLGKLHLSGDFDIGRLLTETIRLSADN